MQAKHYDYDERRGGGVVKTDSFNSTKHDACNCSLSLHIPASEVICDLIYSLFMNLSLSLVNE